MNNLPPIFQTLVKICNSYQDIIIQLDKSLNIISLLAKDDNEILTVIMAIRTESSDKLKDIQKLIDNVTKQAEHNLFQDIDWNVKH